MSETKTVLLNILTTQRLKALFAGKTVVAIVKGKKAKFSDGDSEWTSTETLLPEGTYRVAVTDEDTISAVEVVAPEATLKEKVKDALGVGGTTTVKEPKPAKVRTSGSAGGMSMASLRG